MPDQRSLVQLSKPASKIGANRSQGCRVCSRRLSRRLEPDKLGAEQRFRQWLAGSVIVPLALGLMSLAGAIWVVNNSKVDDCFHRDEEILQIYDKHPEEYKVLVSEQDSLAG